MFISEVVRGGAAELDGRLMQGDQILSVNGEDTRHVLQEAVAAILKVPPRHFLLLLRLSSSDRKCARVSLAVRSWSRPVGAGTAQSCILGFVRRKSGELLVHVRFMVDSSLF